MKLRLLALLMAAAVACPLLAGCSGGTAAGQTEPAKADTKEEGPEAADAGDAEAEAAAGDAKTQTAADGEKTEASAGERSAETVERAALTAAAAVEAGAADAGRTAEASASELTDQEAADAVAAMIDAIYVQEWSEETDAQIAAARAGWDALTDAQKALVNGVDADPDYFGRDTGDASADDPRCADGIGEKELLVVSFGTSFNESRALDIGGIEAALQESFPDWSVRRAFTSQIIINHIQARDGEKIDNVEQALERAKKNGVKNLIVQPTHLMHGAEYDDLAAAVNAAADDFETVRIAEPLLGAVGADAAEVNGDKAAAAQAVVTGAMAEAGYADAAAAAEDGTALVLMGHGTSHAAKISYSQMQTQMDTLGFANVFVGTIEGEPEETACSVIIDKVKEAGYSKVILRPLMVVAGDHANNDMAGDEEDSWKSLFTADGSFAQIDTQIAGLGRIPEIKEIYIAHTAAAIETEPLAAETAAAADTTLADGIYTAVFTTDSSMFHVNEAMKGRGTLTVQDGRMTIHVSLASINIVNLFPGTAAQAMEEGAQLLQPTEDEVTYDDGSIETVYGFDIPVPALDSEFDCALVGTKGKWYDHKVKVSDPVPAQ